MTKMTIILLSINPFFGICEYSTVLTVYYYQFYQITIDRFCR